MAGRKKASATKAPVKQRTLFEHFVKKPQTALQPDPDEEEEKTTLVLQETLSQVCEAASPPATTPKEIDLRISTEPEQKPFVQHSSPPIHIDSDDEVEVTVLEHSKPALSNGSSRTDPILIPSSPIKAQTKSILPTPKPIVPTHSFFAPRARQRSTTPSASTSSAKLGPSTPYPSHDTQHVRGPQRAYASSSSRNPLLATAKRKSPSLPDAHSTHPAISRFANYHDSQDSQKLWTDKWKPNCAEQVLGNEENAVYLRNWLHSLQLEFAPHSASHPQPLDDRKGKGKADVSTGQSKKRRITREVSKRSRKKQRVVDSDDEQSWIVPDDEVEEEEEEPPSRHDHDDYLPALPVPNPIAQTTSSAFPQSLANTIVLTGPCGSGKTAAVYACAEEMGWEVFEVYPGIGKRNSANLDNLVGQVGKNHLVSKAHNLGREEDASRSSLAAFVQGKLKAQSQSHEKLGDASSSSSSTGAGAVVNQSLILLEEVDILFKEDAGFWTGVINMIRECKRPVICTCNDISLLPLLDLPLQETLVFAPCESELAVSYLQSLCAAEGHIIPREDLILLYERARHMGFASVKAHGIGSKNIDLTTPDLRFAIQTLQFWCSERDGKPWSGDGHQPCHHADIWEPDTDALIPRGFHDIELLSFADCHLQRSSIDTPEALALSEVGATGDDELGHALLFSPRDSLSDVKMLGQWDRDELIVSSLSRGARSTFSTLPRYADLARRVADVAVVEQLGQDTGIRGVREQAWVMDYLPWMRHIIAADDEEERRTVGMEVPGGRRTKNSQSQRYVRTICATDEQRQALARTAFRDAM